MQTFIDKVTEDLLNQEGDFLNTKLILPGVRPKAFIKKSILDKGYKGILPEMLTIEELLTEISGLTMISGVNLLIESYLSYQKIAKEVQPFEEFMKWMPTLLKDFDDINSSLCDDFQLLDYMVSEERIKAWGKSIDIGLSELMKNHYGFWNQATEIYYQLNKTLLKQKRAYRGLLAKEASNQLDGFIEQTKDKFVFIGFNAFTKAENQIIMTMKENKLADFYWDTDDYYMNNSIQEAGDFLRKIKSSFGKNEFKWQQNNFIKPKEIHAVSVAKQLSQANFIGNTLKEMTKEERDKTAIVLADEQLLPAVLGALPNEVDRINVTMGLPLKSVPMTTFFKELFSLQTNVEKLNKKDSFYHLNVTNLLNDSQFANYFKPNSIDLIKDITNQNMVFIKEDFILNGLSDNKYKKIFKLYKSPNIFLENTIDWMNLVYNEGDLSSINSEYLFRYKTIFVQLNNLLEKHSFLNNYEVLQRLFNQLLQTENVSFIGEPLVGLQLLGMLETRLIDFENIILASVNEGVLPLGRKENSFIPFDIRRMYKLNTFLENDSIYAYHFYRMIQRCNKVTFLYNIDSEGMGTGEASRFILQLDLESPHEVQHSVASPKFERREVEPIKIPKTTDVLETLNEWKDKISPSSLGSYLYNPIDFYQRYILKLRDEDDEVEEVAGGLTMGSIVHNALEILYAPYLKQVLNEQIFKEINQKKEKLITDLFQKELLKGNEPQGKNLIIMKVVREMVDNVLEKDEKLSKDNELIIMEIEQEFSADFVFNDIEIGFKGLVDRLDQLNGQYRILDYKTGSVNKYDLILNESKLDSFLIDYKGAKALQLIIYAYLFLQKYPNREVVSGIYPLRYFTQDVVPLTYDNSEIISLENIDLLMEPAGNLIMNILDKDIDFLEAERIK